VRALVTGGAGFIGSHIVDRLLREGHETTVLDSFAPRVHRGRRPAHLRAEARLIEGDVRDPAALGRALENVEAVFHQAAHQDHMPDFSEFLTTNAGGTALLYELIVARRLPVSKVIVASSQAVYGEGQYLCEEHGFQQPPAREEARLRRGLWDLACGECGGPVRPLLLREEHANPFNAYALSKLAQEMVALRLGRLFGIPTVALRYSITQGARQSIFNTYSGICRIFSARVLKGLPPIVFEDGLQTRDFVHVEDVVEANMVALRDPRAEGRVFNVGSGRATTVMDYARALLAAFGSPLLPELTGEYRVGDNRHSVSDVARLRELGWEPRRTLREIFDDYRGWIDLGAVDLGLVSEADDAMRRSGVVRGVRLEAAGVRHAG
jgi:dTDP-L-rhamnose 4-epimerase